MGGLGIGIIMGIGFTSRKSLAIRKRIISSGEAYLDSMNEKMERLARKADRSEMNLEGAMKNSLAES